MPMERISNKTNSKSTILVVDDEQDIRELLEYNLNQNGYNTVLAHDGMDALIKIDSKIDLVLLDLMMPNLDGYQTCQKIRNNLTTKNIPIIFLTAKNTDDDEIQGFQSGCDDFIVKPISIKKILVRIKNALKKNTKTPYSKKQNLSFGKILINKDTHQVLLNGKKIKLTKTEFYLLSLLASKNKIFTRQELIDLIWGDAVIISDRSVDVHIRNIRIKIGKQHGDMIKTVSGKGYGIIESYEPN